MVMETKCSSHWGARGIYGYLFSNHTINKSTYLNALKLECIYSYFISFYEALLSTCILAIYIFITNFELT